jgi:hypothetical protein
MLFRPLHQRGNDVLLGCDTAEIVALCGHVRLVVENRRMAGVRYEIGEIGTLRQMSGKGCSRVERDDITYFVTHPCHPPIFNDETDMQAKKDHFGGLFAKQHIVSALMQGPEEAYAVGEEIAKTIWAPVMRSHRVTVEQMAMLEPGLSETVAASLLVVMKQAMDECGARGVPEEAARDFLLGHLNVLGAVIFGEVQGVFSDACNKAIEFGIPALMKDDWKRVFEPQEIADSIKRIT